MEKIAANPILTISVTEQFRQNRLDVFLQQAFPEYSRAFIQKQIKAGAVLVDGQPSKNGYRLNVGENVVLRLPPLQDSAALPEELPLTIIYEDPYLIVLDKPAGLVTHPAPGHPRHTLVNALLHHCQDLKGIGGVNRPGIVHRLDKDTSGLMVIAKDEASYQGLKEQWEARSIVREYQAICQGPWHEPELLLEAPIGRHPQNRKKMAVTAKNSRPALTLFTLQENLGPCALVKASLKTGRTHQIRVHLDYLKRPVLGDQLYGQNKTRKMFPRQALHASHLAFTHPVTGKLLDFVSPLPPDLQALLTKLRKASP